MEMVMLFVMYSRDIHLFFFRFCRMRGEMIIFKSTSTPKPQQVVLLDKHYSHHVLYIAIAKTQNNTSNHRDSSMMRTTNIRFETLSKNDDCLLKLKS